jgi:hypothetical protein
MLLEFNWWTPIYWLILIDWYQLYLEVSSIYQPEGRALLGPAEPTCKLTSQSTEVPGIRIANVNPRENEALFTSLPTFPGLLVKQNGQWLLA